MTSVIKGEIFYGLLIHLMVFFVVIEKRLGRPRVGMYFESKAVQLHKALVSDILTLCSLSFS